MVLFHYIFVCSTMYRTYRISCFSSLNFTVCQLLFIVFMLSYSVNVSVCSVGKMFTHFILGALRSSPYGVGVCSLFKAVLRPLFVLIWQYTCCWVLSYHRLLHISFYFNWVVCDEVYQLFVFVNLRKRRGRHVLNWTIKSS